MPRPPLGKRLIYWLLSSAVALAVGIWAWSVAGRYTASGLFLVFSTLALAWVIQILFKAATALFKEPEAEEARKATGKRRKELEREKAAVLKALKELEFDHEMGKISDADYQEIGGNYRARAVRVMRQLDAQAGDVDYKVLVERDLQNRMRARGEKPAEKAEGKTDGKADAKSETKPADKLDCPGCATRNDPDAEFCKKCGKRLRAEEASP